MYGEDLTQKDLSKIFQRATARELVLHRQCLVCQKS